MRITWLNASSRGVIKELFPKALSRVVTKFLLGGLAEGSSLGKDWVEDHSKMLLQLRKRLSEQKPFRNITLGICLPGTWETYMLLSTLEAGDASIYFSPMFCKPEVYRELQKTSIILVRAIPLRKIDFIYDTDASIGQFIVKGNVEVKGVIEQTTSGVKRYVDYDQKGLLKQPVFDLNSAYVKKVYENRFATGLGLLEALLKLHLFLPSKRVLIVGFGDVGFSCALQLKRLGCAVDVYDIERSKVFEAEKLGYGTGSLDELLPRADVVVTATGSALPALDYEELLMLKNGAILANMGGKGWERDIFVDKRAQRVGHNLLKLIRDDGTYLYELAQGRPVNLVMASGTDIETMDKVFSLGVLTMEYLVKNCDTLPKHVLPVPEQIQLQVS